MHKIQEIKTVTIIGAGNLGWHMAYALKRAGIKILNIISRTEEATIDLADKVSAKALDSINAIQQTPDMFLICVNDDAIAEVSGSIKHTDSIVVHTSGNTSIDVLSHLEHYGVFYPLQTFTKGQKVDYLKVPFLLEASSSDILISIWALAAKISEKVYDVNSEKRKMVHVAAVFAANFQNHLAVIAGDLLANAGLKLDIIRPLMEETSRKIQYMEPHSAQTGPAIREDMKTIEGHMKVLDYDPELSELYKLMSKSIIAYKEKMNE